jgi:hypothetical protein
MKAKNLHFLVVLIFSLFGSNCEPEQEDSCIEDINLGEAIIGAWELTEKSGFPYSSSEFEPVINEPLRLEFTGFGEVKFINATGEKTGSYQVDNEFNRIEIEITGPFEWEVSYFSDCEFIVDIPTDEGLSRLKFNRIT